MPLERSSSFENFLNSAGSSIFFGSKFFFALLSEFSVFGVRIRFDVFETAASDKLMSFRSDDDDDGSSLSTSTPSRSRLRDDIEISNFPGSRNFCSKLNREEEEDRCFVEQPDSMFQNFKSSLTLQAK